VQNQGTLPVESKRSSGFGYHIGSKMVTEWWFRKRPRFSRAVWAPTVGAPTTLHFLGRILTPKPVTRIHSPGCPPHVLQHHQRHSFDNHHTLSPSTLSWLNQTSARVDINNKQNEFLSDSCLYSSDTGRSISKFTKCQLCDPMMFNLPHIGSSPMLHKHSYGCVFRKLHHRDS
jgi:hypothetical protein